MTRLEAAGYIEVEKEFRGKKPNTKLSLTEAGRSAFEDYKENMKQIFEEL
jgi:DNA-binding PadR family transcriptional regulator